MTFYSRAGSMNRHTWVHGSMQAFLAIGAQRLGRTGRTADASHATDESGPDLSTNEEPSRSPSAARAPKTGIDHAVSGQRPWLISRLPPRDYTASWVQTFGLSCRSAVASHRSNRTAHMAAATAPARPAIAGPVQLDRTAVSKGWPVETAFYCSSEVVAKDAWW